MPSPSPVRPAGMEAVPTVPLSMATSTAPGSAPPSGVGPQGIIYNPSVLPQKLHMREKGDFMSNGGHSTHGRSRPGPTLMEESADRDSSGESPEIDIMGEFTPSPMVPEEVLPLSAGLLHQSKAVPTGIPMSQTPLPAFPAFPPAQQAQPRPKIVRQRKPKPPAPSKAPVRGASSGAIPLGTSGPRGPVPGAVQANAAASIPGHFQAPPVRTRLPEGRAPAQASGSASQPWPPTPSFVCPTHLALQQLAGGRPLLPPSVTDAAGGPSPKPGVASAAPRTQEQSAAAVPPQPGSDAPANGANPSARAQMAAWLQAVLGPSHLAALAMNPQLAGCIFQALKEKRNAPQRPLMLQAGPNHSSGPPTAPVQLPLPWMAPTNPTGPATAPLRPPVSLAPPSNPMGPSTDPLRPPMSLVPPVNPLSPASVPLRPPIAPAPLNNPISTPPRPPMSLAAATEVLRSNARGQPGTRGAPVASSRPGEAKVGEQPQPTYRDLLLASAAQRFSTAQGPARDAWWQVAVNRAGSSTAPSEPYGESGVQLARSSHPSLAVKAYSEVAQARVLEGRHL